MIGLYILIEIIYIMLFTLIYYITTKYTNSKIWIYGVGCIYGYLASGIITLILNRWG